ncbi:reverse transcriptase [Gossypium australe]|uniref:Reverse transcriptase n=1 Tax=Gossypium australe TaxID=47621 RepID=A0A5B6VUX4_9ROSI|nr:reverse transcriptase [Gossypium australe]
MVYQEGKSLLLEDIDKRVKLSHSGLTISHLFFANDSLIFRDASIEFESYYWQLINFTKSHIYFSSNVNEGDRALIERELGMRSSMDPKKYLGLLIEAGRNKKISFLKY